LPGLNGVTLASFLTRVAVGLWASCHTKTTYNLKMVTLVLHCSTSSNTCIVVLVDRTKTVALML